ncbi:hypothetical protein F5050DRAFT_1795779, partial [Lentinula boryana]
IHINFKFTLFPLHMLHLSMAGNGSPFIQPESLVHVKFNAPAEDDPKSRHSKPETTKDDVQKILEAWYKEKKI